MGGLLSSGGGGSKADFLLRWQDDDEEVKSKMNDWIKGCRVNLSSPTVEQ